MIVVDASVAVKWYAFEVGSTQTNRLISGPAQLRAPALIRIEVAAALVRKARSGDLTGGEVERLLLLWTEAWQGGTVLRSSDEDDIAAAVTLALALDHPLQDCLYLALAMRLDAPLVTADRRVAARARGHGRIELLGAGSSSDP